MISWLPEQDRLIGLFDHPAALGVGLLIAAAVGVAHALAPGHGKTITAAYLVGTRGRVRDALALGWIVAAMHTVSVVVLALVWVALAGSATRTASLTAWMQFAAAAVVVTVGIGLLRRTTSTHTHTPGPHGTRRHTHVPADGVDPWSRRGLFVLGASGGLLPSPSAFLVLVSGLLAGRALDALLLVVAFAVGMAATLSAVGIVTVAGREVVLSAVGRRGDRLAGVLQRGLPRLGAMGVLGLGVVYLAVSLRAALTI